VSNLKILFINMDTLVIPITMKFKKMSSNIEKISVQRINQYVHVIKG
jgi:hypothetical protein